LIKATSILVAVHLFQFGDGGYYPHRVPEPSFLLQGSFFLLAMQLLGFSDHLTTGMVDRISTLGGCDEGLLVLQFP
jgi:hypothetical protein